MSILARQERALSDSSWMDEAVDEFPPPNLIVLCDDHNRWPWVGIRVGSTWPDKRDIQEAAMP